MKTRVMLVLVDGHIQEIISTDSSIEFNVVDLTTKDLRILPPDQKMTSVQFGLSWIEELRN